MKYILKDLSGGIFGPFNKIDKVDNGYIADNISYQTLVTGELVIEEVSDDYTIPQPIQEQVVTDAPTEETV